MGADITRVPISFFDHSCIRGAAVVEYGVDGKGVLKDGGGGSCSEAAGGIGVLVAQPIRNNVQTVNFSAQKRFTVTGSIEGSLVGLVDAALVGAGLAHGAQALVRLLQPHLGHSSLHAGVLEKPGGEGRNDGGDQVRIDH